jgi:hypothetical protein
MSDAIDTATRCSCGCAVSISDEGPLWTALCGDCYDGTEDAGERAHVIGRGKTAHAALWDWQDQHDEVHGVEWVLADLAGDISRQVSEERDRQRGWRTTASLPVRRLDANAIAIPPITFYGPELTP